MECHRVLRGEGLLIFTFHHGTAEAWDVLARALDEAGFSIRRIWPVYAEMDVGVPVMGKQSVKYDAVLVCRKRGEAVASTMVDTLQALASQVAGETRSLVAMLAEVGDLSEADQRNLSWAVAAMMYTQHQTRLLPSALEGI
jgi:adenine-specific DNA methylase